MATNTLILSDENSFNVSFAGDSSIGISVDNTNPQSVIGDLSTLTTDAQDTLVNAINEVDSHADTNASAIGTLTDLTTSVQTDLVSAINEVDSNTDTNTSNIATNTSAIGTLSNLTTTAKTNLVSAINEVDAHADANATAITSLEALRIVNSATGTIASFSDGSANTLQSLTVGIEPVQDLSNGDPSPTNICPISGHTGVTVIRTNTNMAVFWKSGYVDASGSFITSSYVVNNGLCHPIPMTSGEYIRIAYSSGSGRGLAVFSDATLTNMIARQGSASYYAATQDCYAVVWFNTGTGTTASQTLFDNQLCQVYVSSDATLPTFEIASDQICNISWTDEAGTVYGGHVTVAEDGSAVLTVTHICLDMSTLTWETTSNRAIINGFTDTYGTALPSSTSTLGGYIAEQYTETRANGSLTLGTFAILQDKRLIFYYDGVDTPTGKIVCPLATPLTYTLSDVSQLSSLLGTNNIWNTTGDTTVSYIADTKLYIDNAIAVAVANI